MILGDPNEGVACAALYIFNKCDNSQLWRHIEAAMETQQQTILILQYVQANNDDNFFLLSFEVKETQKMCGESETRYTSNYEQWMRKCAL